MAATLGQEQPAANAAASGAETVRQEQTSTTRLKLETVLCPLCGADEFLQLLSARDALTGSDVEFSVVSCRRCNLAFTNPRPTKADVWRFYPPHYKPHQTKPVGKSAHRRLRFAIERDVLRRHFGYPPGRGDRWTAVRALIGRTWIRRRELRSQWIPYCPQGRLLDFGCGSGEFLERMQALGWDAEGVELCETTAQEVASRLGLTVHVGSLPHADIPTASFDLITMWQSLEHVGEPRLLVQAASDALKPGGRLIAAVPNFASWSAAVFQSNWFALDLPRHLTHFDPQTLVRMLSSEGFEIERVDFVGKDGWIRHSARREIEQQGPHCWSRAFVTKPVARAVALGSEIARRADCIVAIAKRI